MARSVVTAFDGPEDDILELSFYSDDACTELYELQNDLTCVANPDNEFKSYLIIFSRVRAANTSSVAERSPREVERDIDVFLTGSKDNLRPRASDKNLGSPKSYDSATLWALAGGVSLASLATECYGVGDAAAVSEKSCILGILGSAISAVTNTFNLYKGLKAIKAHWDNNGFSVGLHLTRGRIRLGEEDRMLTLSAEEYTELVLEKAGLSAKHIGYMQRPENQGLERPAYQFTTPDGIDYVYSLHGDANGEVGHSIAFARNARIEKRQEPAYDGVHIDSGGLDIQVRQRKSANYNVLPPTAKAGYAYLYDDLACLLPSGSKLGQGNYVSVNIVDTDANVVMTIGMAPYKPGEPVCSGRRPACDHEPFYFSSTCIN